MATAAPTNNRVYLYRLLTLNTDSGTLVVRNLIDERCSNTPLTTVLARERRVINNLRTKSKITKVQFDLLYPQNGIPTTADFDLTLAICLLRSLKHFGLNPKYNWNVTPPPGDISQEADLYRLRMYRNEFAHISSTVGIQEADFVAKWDDIERALHRLNSLVQNPVKNLQQIIDDCKTGPLDPEAENEIEKQIEKMQKMEGKLEEKVQNMEKGVADVKEDINTVSKRVDELEKQKESEGTQKAVRDETPSLLQRLYRQLTYPKRKKGNVTSVIINLKLFLISVAHKQY
ncbi:E3 ubiquitin-protein ligase DZIP3-like [Mercenaria mercenaria]|uniref:E3 ubiquitin-protein ligase DZIP3-like n=1 Tax=Mercenaria mercenaria TaxID=6596 RepID=UPI00234F65F9|nr:E3 ubiquitin-protein ligase DZIP3-like [Mercenaria mercenaria]